MGWLSCERKRERVDAMTGETAITVAIAVIAALWLAMVGDKAVSNYIHDQLNAPTIGDAK